jgi:thioredoxin 1
MEKQSLPRSFEELIRQSDLPVLADFWAEWCGACRAVSPAVERIASDLKGRLITVKVNVDRQNRLAASHRVESIPTIILFHRGKTLMRLTGAHPYETLKAEIEKQLEAARTGL